SDTLLDKFFAAARLLKAMSLHDFLNRLYDDHAQALFAFLLNFTRSEHDTQDLLQELFVKLARQPNLLDDVRDKRGFLLRLAHNLAVDLIRRRGTRERANLQLAADSASLFAP